MITTTVLSAASDVEGYRCNCYLSDKERCSISKAGCYCNGTDPNCYVLKTNARAVEIIARRFLGELETNL